MLVVDRYEELTRRGPLRVLSLTKSKSKSDQKGRINDLEFEIIIYGLLARFCNFLSTKRCPFNREYPLFALHVDFKKVDVPNMKNAPRSDYE